MEEEFECFFPDQPMTKGNLLFSGWMQFDLVLENKITSALKYDLNLNSFSKVKIIRKEK